MNGKIVRGIAGFYYVHVKDAGIFECKAKGIFRNNNIKPLVGDNASLEILDREKKLGNITKILPRKNSIIRPAVANIDQAAVIIAASYPKPDLNLLDRFLLMMRMQEIPAAVCFNKTDAVDTEELLQLTGHYRDSGCTVYMTSTVTDEGIAELKEGLEGKTTVLAGPSGVGKSSVINRLFPEAKMAVGDISSKIKRGRHTTRHSELLSLGNSTYVMDTPGFTSLMLMSSEKEELKQYYPEFEPYAGRCRFLGCSHINEPGCAVKAAVEDNIISQSRYSNYKQFYEETSHLKKY
ncbi:MAG TPA: ribosome small subunit-dependent GTPase A [Lachnospiraceae bacterium]|nr:ribosome small subunit-dependent GTPase A [Lachnospiraceae bacterium]